MAQGRKRVFASYDFEKDKALRDLTVGQSRLPDLPLKVADWSMKEAMPDVARRG